MSTEKERATIERAIDRIVVWDEAYGDQLKKAYMSRRYIYDRDYEKDSINMTGTDASSKIAINLIRSSVNRIKADMRDLQPQLNVIQKSEKGSEEMARNFQDILEQETLNPNNMNSTYSCGDDLIDLSLCAMWVKNDYESNDPTCMDKKLIFEHIADLQNVFFDVRPTPARINEDARYMGYINYLQVTDLETMRTKSGEKVNIPKKYNTKFSFKYGNFYKVIDYYEKISKKVKLAQLIQNLKWEIYEPKEDSKYVWNGKTQKVNIKVREIAQIHHYQFFDDQIISSSILNIDHFPIVIGFGLTAAFGGEEGKTGEKTDPSLMNKLVPFADHAIDAQKTLDFSASVYFRHVQLNAVGGQLIYPVSSIPAGLKSLYEGRFSKRTDLPYKVIKDINKNPIPALKPEMLPPVPLPPAVAAMPTQMTELISRLLGTHLEQDVNLNTSGEAIRQRRIIANKSAKLYIDNFVKFISDVGHVAKDMIPITYDNERVVALKKHGKVRLVAINQPKATNTKAFPAYNNPMRNIFDEYDLDIRAGSSAAVRKEKTAQALATLYQTTPGPLQAPVGAKTIDIYSAALDCKEADEISRRLSSIVDPTIVELGNGTINMKQYEAQAQQKTKQAQQEQQNNPAVQLEMAKAQAEIQEIKASAQSKMMTAEAKIHDLQNDKQKLQIDLEKAHLQLQATSLKANAEIAKAVYSTQTHSGDKNV